MNIKNSEFLELAKNDANEAADRMDKAWGHLNATLEPTLEDIKEWVSLREEFYKKQGRFEEIIMEIYGKKTRN